jgi:PPM family protein phosphatase
MLRVVETVWRTDTGRQRRGNEDSAYVRAPVFVVADGMGGAQAGEVASRIAVERFEQGLPDEGTPEVRLAVAAKEANREIHELSHGDRDRAGMGTTLTAAYVDDAEIAIAHVGDSRAYMFREGELVRLTQDHTLVDELFRRGKLTEEEALNHPQRSIITRALGPEPEVDVDTWSYPARAGDVLLLCSDGLTSMISETQIAEILAAAPSLQVAADQLIDEANEAGGRDNITVVLCRLGEVDGDFELEQPTLVDAVGGAAAIGRDGASRVRGGRARARLARTQGRPVDKSAGRQLGRRGKLLIALISTAIVLFLFGGGGYLAIQQLYFLGTNAQGLVVVYRGLPYTLPFGIPMYDTFYISGLPASLIPADRRSTLLNHAIRSQTSAINLVNDLELGRVSQ